MLLSKLTRLTNTDRNCRRNRVPPELTWAAFYLKCLVYKCITVIDHHLQLLSHIVLPPLQGVPEDLLFFYQNIRQGGGVARVDQCLLVYRYHEKATTHSVAESVPLLHTHTHTHTHTHKHKQCQSHTYSQLPTGIPDFLRARNSNRNACTDGLMFLWAWDFKTVFFGIPYTFPALHPKFQPAARSVCVCVCVTS